MAHDRALRADAAQRGLDNVLFTGRLDKNMIPNVLSLSDVCLIHLRKSETFMTVMPSKIFDAAGMARPIILGVDGFARRLCRESAAVCTSNQRTRAELVEAVLLLADDTELRARLGEAGYDYVVREFDRDRLAARYLEIIEQVVDHEAAG